MLALYRQETIILHSIGFKIMGFMAFTCSKPRKPDTFFLDQTLPGCEASCMYKLPSGSRQTRPNPPPPPLPNPQLIPVAAVLKKKRARVAKREKEPAVAHDALRLISLKNTLDTKTIWENMYSVIEKAAVIEKISVYFFIVVVIIIIIFIFYYFFFHRIAFSKNTTKLNGFT